MLEIKNVTRKYQQFVAVDNVSFTVNKGEIIGLLGHNGAGKTTIMKMLSGYLEANEGSITVGGLALDENLKKIQLSLGYLPESLPVYPEMIVADYLDYAADLKGLTGDDKISEIKRVIKATDIHEKLLAPIAELSRGYKQRVGVAQAILGRPKLLILDEPTNGLDPKQTQHMRDLIIDIAQDATVILSTHIMQEVEALCSRVLIVHGGKLVVDETLSALKKTNQILLHCSLNNEEIKQHQLANITGIKGISLFSETAEHPRLNNESYNENNDPVNNSKLSKENNFKYRIEVNKSENYEQISAQLAEKVVNNGGKLYGLTIVKRDLESLFKDANEQQYQQGESHEAA